MKNVRKMILAGGTCLMSSWGFQAAAQLDVRFTEVPNYNSKPCAKGKGRNLSYQKPAANADAGYKALFGVWCGLNEKDQNDYLIAISEDSEPYKGQVAQTVKLSVETNTGLIEAAGVVFFDTRQKRWAMVMDKGETWVMWPEAGGRLGQARGKFSGKTVRIHKGRKQTWVLLSRVR